MNISFGKLLSNIKGDSRSAIVRKNVFGSFIVRGISILISLILVPLTIGYVSSELYGIWLTLATIISWASLFDLGFGNGLRNKVAECVAVKDWEKAKSYISTAYVYFAAVFLPLSLLFYIVCGLFNWCALLNVPDLYQELLVKVMRIVIVFFSITMIAKILSTVLAALQMNAMVGVIEMIGQLVILILTYCLTITTSPSLVYLAWVISAGPFLVFVIASFWFYGIKYRKLCPSIRFIDTSLVTNVLNLGVKFFVMQISVIIMYQTMNILISHVSGPESVTEYNVIYKYISIPLMGISMIVAPLWSAFTDAYTLKDYDWMRQAYKKVIRIFVLFVIVTFILTLISPIVFYYWLGDKVIIHRSLVITCAIYVMIMMWNSMHSALINGLSKIQLMLNCTIFGMIVDIPLAYVLGMVLGTQGVVIGVGSLNLLGVILMRIQVLKIFNQTASGIWDK